MRSSYQCSIVFEVVDEASKLSFPVEVEHQFDEEEALWLVDLLIWEDLLVDVENSPKKSYFPIVLCDVKRGLTKTLGSV